MLFDTHCHIDASYFPEGAAQILGRARSASVSRFACIGVGGLRQAESAVALAESEPDVVATVGVHPHDAASADDLLVEQIVVLGQGRRVVAIGEVGLDYHYDHSPRDVQRDVFRRFIAHARELKKPIVVHTRNAASDTLAILEEERARDVGGIIHCFSEDRAFAERALALDFDLSFSGIVTFKNADSIREVAAWAPPERILLETDSPYLAPQPVRGKRCEPAFVLHTARFVAALRGISLEALAQLTTNNALRRFGLESARTPSHHPSG
jgi:TatD DNase family protein